MSKEFLRETPEPYTLRFEKFESGGKGIVLYRGLHNKEVVASKGFPKSALSSRLYLRSIR